MNIGEKCTHNCPNSVMLMATAFTMHFRLTLSMNTSSFFPTNVSLFCFCSLWDLSFKSFYTRKNTPLVVPLSHFYI